jgi:anti-sigma B factor antagonist
MNEPRISVNIRNVTPTVNAIDIQGDVNASAEKTLSEAYTQASTGVRAVLLNFSEMEYMNSSGIGLLVTLLVRANRLKQKLLACGLSEHYQRIFKLTRLNEAIQLFDDEAAAVAAA